MPRFMRAAVLNGIAEPLRLVDRPIPEPGVGQVRVRIQACGVCGSDLFLQSGGFGADRLPRIPGHEAAGVVDAVGPDAGAWREGAQVALYYIDADPSGRWSQAGRENLQPGLTRMGVDVDGAFAEYVVRPARTLLAPNAPIEPAALAVLTDAVATPYHAVVRVARVQPGETVLVIGVGGVGSNAVQIARYAGARVVALSRSPHKVELARGLGAHIGICSAGEEEDIEQVRAALDGGWPDVVVQCVGSAGLDELAIRIAGPGARVVLVGATTDRFSARSVDLIWRELAIMGSRGFTYRDVAEVIDLYLDGAVSVDHLTSVRRPLEQANAAFEDLRARLVMRTILTPETQPGAR